MEVTLWEKWVPEKQGIPGHWEHNHLEYGHSLPDKPIPKYPNQSYWVDSTWKKIYAHIDGYKVVSVSEGDQ